MSRLTEMKIGESVQIGQWVVVRKSKDVFRLGELMGDWLMHGDEFSVCKRLGQLRNSPRVSA
jgi:hypothetical protein